MTEAVANKRNDKALRKLIAGLVSAVGETMSSLVDKTLNITPGNTVQQIDSSDWVTSLGAKVSILRGALDKDFAGKHLLIAIDLVDAIALSDFLMMTPDEVIHEHRSAGTLEGDNLEAFGEVGNVLCSGMDGTLREVVGSNVGLRLQDHGMVKPGFDQEGFLPEDDMVVYNFGIQIGDFPKTEAFIILDPETARQWNHDKPVLIAASGEEATEAVTPDGPAPSSLEVAEDIPQAPIRGKLSAFVVHAEAQTIVRQCGRRIGLEVQRHAKTDIPNPAAHRGQIVLIEIPVGEDKRFDWAKRIKSHHADIPIVLLLHEPSRQRVVQGFMTQADTVCAWPSTEPQLSSKLSELLEKLLAAADAEDEEV